ncbi:hypothetical protein [Collimonas silvisoli]|uniref:hypothetical protein n=1 Tax=Collimonas silvisoli TaxID=2825884 RepID=UPI001B8C9D88|nr:hypothetical protein [Collimonas silvisoli]
MNKKIETLALVFASAAMVTLAGCGGGSSSSGGSPAAPAAAAAASVQGTAATGAALANAAVAVTNSSGNSPCQETSITTTALGSYTCTLKAGEAAPFFVVVTDPAGNTAPLVSVATSTPAAGAALTVNATPLTTAILAQLSADGNPMTLVSSKAIDTAALAKVTANVLAQLANVLTAIGAPAGYDPFATSITAATASGTGNTADQILDVVKVVTDPATGKLALSTVGSPTPVTLATATNTGTAVAAPTYSVSDLSQAAQITAQAFKACFALPTAQRVLATNTATPASQGGPEVTSAAAACQSLVADTSNAAKMNFLHNGYSAAQLLYGILTSDSMTGAQFSVPEIMAFYPAANTAAGADEAVLNIRYLDANGNPGNVITVARNLANTASTARPTNWWLVGNQNPVDVTLKLTIRRVEQLNSALSPSNSNLFSTFQTGIQVNVNSKGPGSINSLGSLAVARISGPGLPGNGASGTGLVYVAPIQQGQLGMDLFNKTGDITLAAGARCGNSNNLTYNCPNFWFSRTSGITGAAATTLASNQTGLVWAQPADSVNPQLFVKGTKYKIELFYGSDKTTPIVLYKTLLSDLIQAEQAVNLPWNKPGPQTLSALDPAGSLAGAQTNLTVDWVQNIAAQQISGVQAIVDSSGSYGQMLAVPRGASSAVLSAVPAFSALAVGNAPPSRTLLFAYRMLDNSNKTAVYRYN